MTFKVTVGGLVTVLVIMLGYWGISSGEGEATPQEGIPPETVADYVHAVIQADRTIYTTHVVERMQVKGIVVASENWEQRDALPLPAQFLIEAARLVSEQRTGIRYRLMSLSPINERNRAMTEFDRTGLKAVAENPDRPYSEIVTNGRNRVFHAIYADRAVSQTCIGCHNAHPNSPKRDFKLNDVMGGIMISIPLGR